MNAPGGEPALTVSELTDRIKRLVEEEFPDVWVVGEISRPRAYPSGHLYLTLKDDDAVVSAVIWRSTAARLPFEPEEGMEVLVRGRLNLYPPRGQYQLDIRVMEPRGIGGRQMALEQLKARLAAEGLFDEDRKRPLPFLPRGVGVVTSPAGAAVRDVIKVLGRRNPGVPVVLAPALVQGEGAAESVAAAIGRLAVRDDLDVLIVGRGGGSLEDLWAFNEEVVARAIAACPIPVVSAVGHETDVTIADFVADVRAPTPSAAAEVVVPEIADVRNTLVVSGRRALAGLASAVSVRRGQMRAVLGSWSIRRVPDRLRGIGQELDDLSRRAGTAATSAVGRTRERMSDLAARAEALSPLAVLGRGYSVTTREGATAPVTSASDVEVGEHIRIRLAGGGLGATVTERES